MSAPREAALSSFAAPSSSGNRSKSSHVRVVARLRPMNEQEQHGVAALQPIIPQVPIVQHSSPPRSVRKGPFKFLTPKRKSKAAASSKNTTPQRAEDATPVIRNGQRLFAAPSPGKPPKSQTEYGTAKSLSAQQKLFDFDAVFTSDATQKEVYDRSVGDAVRRNIFRGYNTTIIAYGQTGSGKTFTMGGKRDADLANMQDMSPTNNRSGGSSSRSFAGMIKNNSSKSLGSLSGSMDDTKGSSSTFTIDEDDGIIPRAVHDLFKAKQRHESAGEVTIQLTYLEIYNDELRDLLVDGGEEPTYMKLSDQGDDGVVVKGLTCVTVKSTQQVKELMEEAAKRRTTASTRMNLRSSRSHAICSLLVTINPATKAGSSQSSSTRAEVITAKLSLVDLAGSERIKETGVVGLHQQESININKDLFVLGKVISSLSDKMKSSRTVHVPYRDSKLTRLLRDSLGGNCCTVMVACVSPSEKNLDESVNTLRYAERARTITNAVKQNVVKAVMTPAECAAMRGENKMLKTKVKELMKRVKLLEQRTENLDELSVQSGITMDDLSLGASIEERDDSLKKKFIETEESTATDAQLDAKNLALMSLDLEIAEKKELVEKLRKEATELETTLSMGKVETTTVPTSRDPPVVVAPFAGTSMAAPGTKIEMVNLSNNGAKNDISEQQARQHAKEIRVLEEKVQSLIQVNGGLRQELTVQMQRTESLQEEGKDTKENVDALVFQLEFEKKRIVEHEASLKKAQTELREAVEERDGYRMKIAIQADEIAKREQERSTLKKQVEEIGKLRFALTFSEQQVQQLKQAAQEKENERQSQSVTSNAAKGVLTTHNSNVEPEQHQGEESQKAIEMKLSPFGTTNGNGSNCNNPADCDSSFDTTGHDSEGSDHKAIRLQAAKMLFFANKAIERGRETRSVCSSIGSSNVTEFKPEMSKIRSMINESAPTGRSAPSALFPKGKPPTPGKPPRMTGRKRSPTKPPLHAEDEGPIISNIDQIVSMNECLCSKDPEYVDFFLPKLGATCSCDDQNGGGSKEMSMCEGDDPLALDNILRDWQVDFLHSVDIHTAKELVLVYNKMGGVLAKEMRKWRRKKKLVSVKTASCGVALHIWTRTCKAVIKSVQKQIAEGAKAIKRPAILEVAWTSDNNTAVSSLGSSLAEF